MVATTTTTDLPHARTSQPLPPRFLWGCNGTAVLWFMHRLPAWGTKWLQCSQWENSSKGGGSYSYKSLGGQEVLLLQHGMGLSVLSVGEEPFFLL